MMAVEKIIILNVGFADNKIYATRSVPAQKKNNPHRADRHRVKNILNTFFAKK
jgi:hypothetical protein